MGRAYAGILGSIAFAVVVAHSFIHGQSVTIALYAAMTALFAFAAVGLVIGWIADRTIVEAIEARFHAQLKADHSSTMGVLGEENPASGRKRPA